MESTKFQSLDLLFVLRNYHLATAVLSLFLVKLSLQSQSSALVWQFCRGPTIAFIEKRCIFGVHFGALVAGLGDIMAFQEFGLGHGWNSPGRFAPGQHGYTWRS